MLTLPDWCGRRIGIVCLALVLVVGVFLRHRHRFFSGANNPAHSVEFPYIQSRKLRLLDSMKEMYRGYLITLSSMEALRYPTIVGHYIELQLGCRGRFCHQSAFFTFLSPMLGIPDFRNKKAFARFSESWELPVLVILTLCLAGLVFAWRLEKQGGIGHRRLLALMSVRPHSGPHVATRSG